ncbi:MAG: alpha-L-arabinofuranosidase C-terminal domain-containing protein [Planctomycetota bacterium]
MLFRLPACAAPALLAAAASLSAAQGRAAPAPGNPVPNPSFEAGGPGGPAGWAPSRWTGEGTFELASPGRTGERCVAIRSASGADVSWQATVPVRILSRYRLAGWIRTEGVDVAKGGRGALFNIHDLQPVATPAVAGTSGWTRVEVEFDTGLHDSILLNCLLGGWGEVTGAAWYDDVMLELLSTPEFEPGLVIDAGAVGEPISKFIYGQFIEHLGRCIYGGIWAEMLEDRKFFFAVGAAESPWRARGEPGSVRMATDSPFTGAQTPEIALPGGGGAAGIVQGGLGLVAGREYVGRIWLAGDPGAGEVEIALVWGDAPAARDAVRAPAPGPDYARTELWFTPGATTDFGRLEVRAAGTGAFRVGAVSLMPADNVHGLRADTLALLRELDAPIYRWPGGNFVSGYDWRDGIGDRDRRPPRKNPAWRGIEPNDFGLDEFLAFCRELGTEPYIALNSGLGEVESAVDELRYANDPPDSPLGQLRAANGHPAPYGVHFWGIGNEMYGDWQLGHMPLAEYVQKHNRFAAALRAADPSIELVGVGAVGPWSETMLTACAEHMDLLSEHFYRGEAPGLIAHVAQIPEAVRAIAAVHRRYRETLPSLAGRAIRIALDEWNYWYGPAEYGEIGTRYFLKDALGIAAGLQEYARNSDLYFMANYAQTVNVIGCIKTTKTAAAFDPPGLVLSLYRRQFGVLPVATTCAPPLDAMAALTADGRVLTIGVVNPTREAVELPLSLAGAALAGPGTVWRIAGDDPQASNTPGEPPGVVVEEEPFAGPLDRLAVAPCGVTLFALDLE